MLAAILSATGEKNPHLAWSLNIQSLLNVLEIAKDESIHKVYWSGSTAIYGPTSPKIRCHQQTIIEPATVYRISKYAGDFGVIIFTIVTRWMSVACVTWSNKLQK
ncbi:MAG: NAD-dependent epimerase/dehydratase family protein [Ginsengibacter sp.]